jgi:predicted TIM-barrel fold metal-dependent hydrolase
MTTAGSFVRGLSAFALLAWSGVSLAAQPFADVHVHFNWDQRELIDAARVVAKLDAAGVEFAVVAGTPSELALELARVSNGRVIPLFSPYIHELGRRDWHQDRRVVARAEAGLSTGNYHGIGEIHFMAGFPPRADNDVFRELMALAGEYRVPVLIHIDSGNAQTFLEICRTYPLLDILFAHAGGNLRALHIRRIVEACPNAWIEFSARDPWRYGGLTGDDGRLLAEWRALVLDYPDRFVTGTDPVWRVTRTQSWDLADDGWDYFEQLIAWHRTWLADLPEAVRRQVSVENARRLFGRQ